MKTRRDYIDSSLGFWSIKKLLNGTLCARRGPETGCLAVVEGPLYPHKGFIPSTYHSSAISGSALQRHQSLIQHTHGDDNERRRTELQAAEINARPAQAVTHVGRVCFDCFRPVVRITIWFICLVLHISYTVGVWPPGRQRWREKVSCFMDWAAGEVMKKKKKG